MKRHVVLRQIVGPNLQTKTVASGAFLKGSFGLRDREKGNDTG